MPDALESFSHFPGLSYSILVLDVLQRDFLKRYHTALSESGMTSKIIPAK
jgi:hypothetical protein